MTDQITIRGDGGEIALHVVGREDPLASNPYDLDWLRASLTIKVGRLFGTANLSLTSSELNAFREQLEAALRSLKGPLHFATIEHNWTLDVAFERSGAVVLTGSVRPDPAIANTLNYEFRSDPISLEAVARDIRRISEAYPAPVPNNF